MILRTVDLYAEFGLPRPQGARGTLKCWLQEPNPEVNGQRRFPAGLILPGGAYVMTSLRDQEPLVMKLLVQGYSAFVLEYSVAPVCFPVQLREAVMAMVWLRRHADTLRILPHRIAAMGFSAGGHLCGTLGTLFDGPEVQDLLSEHARPDALVLGYPVCVSHGRTHDETFENISGGDEGLKARLSLDRLVRPDMPPVFLWHTADDPDVPARNSLLLAAALDEAAVSYTLHIYRQGPHGLSAADFSVYRTDDPAVFSPDAAGWMDAMFSFLRELGFGPEESEKIR